MRRWLTILLLVFLPLQFSWTAAAAYCQHEQASGSGHFGHHEHKHAASTASKADAAPDAAHGDDSDDSAPAPGAQHTDCAFCHLSVAKSFGSLAVALPVPAMALHASGPSAAVDAWLSERIDRPNWHRA